MRVKIYVALKGGRRWISIAQLVGSPVNCTVRRAAVNSTTAEVVEGARTPAQEEAAVLDAIMASNPNLRATQVRCDTCFC